MKNQHHINRKKAKAVTVPEDSSYITEGKIYEIDHDSGVLFSVVDDDGDVILCCFDGLCGHGISWIAAD